jgi:sialidase-1
LAAQEQVLFASGDMGYQCFRIPALVTWSDGELFAFAEGRKDNCADFGDVDILVRRSTDGGTTWSAAEVVVNNGELQAGNATPVLDRLDPKFPQGRLFLFYNTGTASEQAVREGKGRRQGFYITSADHGKTWSDPVDITPQVHFDHWSQQPQIDARTLAFAPGHALQLSSGPFKGRLLLPANHSYGPPQERFKDYRSFALYSDDHGVHWKHSDDVNLPSSNEAMAVQVHPEKVLLLVRVQDNAFKTKLIASSSDGGASWEHLAFPENLTTPVCQSAVLHVPELQSTFHLGPANTEGRNQLSLWKSTDLGVTWPQKQLLWEGSAAYSDMVYLGQGQLGVFFERKDYQEIVFQTIPVE